MISEKLIIFDCDGVLIDSETVVCRLVSEAFARLGHPMPLAEVIRRFAGRPEPEMIEEVEREWGHPLPREYFDEMASNIAEAYRTELRALPGAAEVLERITIPFCVASSSAPKKLKLGLESAGLLRPFGDNLVSVSYVARGKPAPDVFIYAAGWMRTPIADSLVIEDSIPGVRAARGAGLRVIGFSGGGHCPPDHADRLLEAGAERVFRNLLDLESILPAAFQARSSSPV